MFSKILALTCLAAVASADKKGKGKGKGSKCGVFADCSNTLYTLRRELHQCQAEHEDVSDEIKDLASQLRDQYQDRTGLYIKNKDYRNMLRADFEAQYWVGWPAPVGFMLSSDDVDCDGTEAPVVGGIEDWQECADMTEIDEDFRDYLNELANPTRYAKANIVSPGSDDVTGTVLFTQTRGQSTRIQATINGLEINDAGTEFEGLHGFHIHTYGTENGCGSAAAGGHYNPFAVTHGAPTDDVRHVGDLGNILAEVDGASTTATLDITSEQVTLFGDLSILGRSIVIHASYDRLDDGEGVITYSGNSGSRVACGTIGLLAAPAP